LLKTPILDLHFEDITRLHENRWLARRPNATGCSGDDHITRLQTHRDAGHCDQLGRSSGPECATHGPPGGTASAVTSQGPNAPVASKFLPIVHCGVRS
jgi:hypothetical protein